VSDPLDQIIAGKAPEDQAKIMRSLLEKHRDPADPLFELLQIFDMGLKLHEQTIAVRDEFPEKFRGLLSEIDEQFDYRYNQWRALPPAMGDMVRDEIQQAIPRIIEGVRNEASTAVQDELTGHRVQFSKLAKAVLEEHVGVRAPGQAAPAAAPGAKPKLDAGHDPRSYAVAGVFVLFIMAVGMWIGSGWAQHHPSAEQRAERAAAVHYTQMVKEMPPSMRAWVERWHPR